MEMALLQQVWAHMEKVRLLWVDMPDHPPPLELLEGVLHIGFDLEEEVVAETDVLAVLLQSVELGSLHTLMLL